MLFHITHTHTWESCPVHDPEKVKNTFGKTISNIDKVGVKMVGLYTDPPGHTVYMIVESDTIEKLEILLDPIIDLGHIEIRPVSDGLATLNRRTEES